MNEYAPTKAMQSYAKRGLELHTGGTASSVTPRAIEVGKKIASGQKLGESHVTDMAHFHSSHDACPKDDCEDMLWGGPAGEIWAKNKLLQTMNTGFAEENIDFDKLMDDENTKLSFELFSNLDEPEITLGTPDDNGYIWAPILRSGMLATRPGPNGEKLDEPLIFVPGHSENQRKEIGLQDVYDAFKDGAIEHVTIPTSHNNELLENTGFIRDLKIVDSQRHPGEKVVLAAHDFTEPDINEKVQRGTIASRSCGLLYDYRNTTTGKTYPVALEHTALTNKPWMGGMTPYGTDSELFSDRTIVPLMMSEKPLSAPIEAAVPTKLAQENLKSPQTSDRKENKREFLADVQWGDQPSYRDIEDQINKLLAGMGSQYDSYPFYYVIDCTDGKVLIRVEYGVGSDNDAWVAPYTCKDGQVELAPFSEWIDVTKKWVNDTIDPEKDRGQLDKLKMSENLSDTNLAVLTSKARGKLPDSAFVYPGEKRYPIHDIAHGRNALARVAQNGTPEEQAKVRAAVYKRYPELKKNSSTKMSDPLKVASAKRLGLSESNVDNKPPGGQMTLLAMSEEQMGLLGLSEEAKEFQRSQNKQIEEMNAKLAESQAKEREARVSQRITDLKGEGFDAFPGLLVEIEKTLMSDDGDVALKLQLSEHGQKVEIAETATQMAERIIAAIPRKDGKVDLGEQANKLETPDLDRPADKPDDPTAAAKPKTGADLAEQWIADDPTLAKDPVILAMSENGKGK